MTFLETGPTLARALAEHDYADPTPVQAAVLAPEAEGRDIVVSAQTGSGKTVAYGLAIASGILADDGVLPPSAAPVALIIAPTRELALQVERELRWLYAYTGARIVSCVGGMDARLERRKLQEGADIVVGTPGRLRDHIERRALNIEELVAVVLDEADEMLDLGFREDLEFILEATPKDRRTLLFSATIPKGIAALAKRYQRNALRIEVAAGERGHADIEYRAIRVAPNEAEHAVVNLLRLVESDTAIVFCNTREAVRHLQATLLERGFNAVLLSGELSQHERNMSMQALRDGRARVCVATDVAARGIDVPNLGLVIHFDLPHDAEVLQHRSGRTGRAGRKGISALLVPPIRRRRAELLLRDAGADAQWSGPPTLDDVRKLDDERLLQDPMWNEAVGEDDAELARALLEKHTPEQLASALARLYRSRLPTLEDVTDPGMAPSRREVRYAEERGQQGSAPQSSYAPRTDAERSRPRPERSSHERMGGGGVWFKIDVGRERNADPKWIVPMLCRKGGITKKDIGVISISAQETRFEVSEAVAEQFAAAMHRPGGENIRIEKLDAAQAANAPPHATVQKQKPKPEFAKKPYAERASGDKPAADKPGGDRPFADRPHGKPPFPKKPRFDDKPRQEGKPHQASKPRFEDRARPQDASGAPQRPKRFHKPNR